MAATCPKCGGKLKLTDWRPNCPHCGVNMVYYGMEERLLLDADKAEAEHARTQPRIDRLKAAFVGSKLAIARIVFSVLPIAALFLPIAKFAFKAPYVGFPRIWISTPFSPCSVPRSWVRCLSSMQCRWFACCCPQSAYCCI